MVRIAALLFTLGGVARADSSRPMFMTNFTVDERGRDLGRPKFSLLLDSTTEVEMGRSQNKGEDKVTAGMAVSVHRDPANPTGYTVTLVGKVDGKPVKDQVLPFGADEKKWFQFEAAGIRWSGSVNLVPAPK